MTINAHNELFRVLATISPEFAEKLITAWGTVDLHLLVDDVLKGRNKSMSAFITEPLARQLERLEAEHRENFPQFANCSASKVPDSLAQVPGYVIVKTRFPHIGDRLAIAWGTNGFHPYVVGLLDGGGRLNRQGFPLEHAKALAHLRRLHDELFPKLIPKQASGWEISID